MLESHCEFEESISESNLFRMLVVKLSEQDESQRALVELAGILSNILSGLVLVLTSTDKEGGLEQVRRYHGTFLQASEAISLLLACSTEFTARSGSNRRLTRFAEQCERQLQQVCHYGVARYEYQRLYRAELKALLHSLLDTVRKIAASG